MQTTPTPTRGARNHNPLNIRKGFNWQGEDPHRTDTDFEVFANDLYGYRAAFIIIRTYIKKHRCNTPARIITRWAPPSENDTAAYIACVVARSKLHPDIALAYEDSTRICALVSAMAWVESRAEPSQRILATAYGMTLK